MADKIEQKAIFLRLQGRVQGVWFRAWMKEEADKRGIQGWVRNRTDGSVEAMMVGPGDQVDDLLEACHGGPPLARIDKIDTQPATGVVPRGFETRSSG
jgi:acylphosphatase